jgi:hypothetical protein
VFGLPGPGPAQLCCGDFSVSELVCVVCPRGADFDTRKISRIQDSIVSSIPEKTAIGLRIAQAYVKLLCIPEGSSEESVTLARIGNCEVRIFEGSEACSEGTPLFWLELFDHCAKSSIDSFGCYRIGDAVVVFDDFVSHAGHLNEGSRPDGGGTQN